MINLALILVLLLCVLMAVSLPQRRGTRVTIAIACFIVAVLFIATIIGVLERRNWTARKTIHTLAEDLHAGNTSFVSQVILNSDKYMPANKFDEHGFWKLSFHLPNVSNTVEQTPAGDSLKLAPQG